MATSDPEQEQELRIQRQIAFASGLFQGDVTIRNLLESLAEGVVIIDNSRTILLVNTAAEQMFGYLEKELIGKPHAVLIPERFHTLLEKHEAGYFEKPRIKPTDQFLDLAGRRRDGSEFPVEINLSFIETISGVFLLAFISDITLRKQLETGIQDAREYAENIVETVREPLVVLNSDLKLLTANHSFYDTFKVTPEATIGNFIYDLGNRQWDIPKLRVLIEEILPRDTVINGYEVEHDFPGIGRKTILLNARQIFRKDIGSHIILLAMENITERKQAEGALRESEESFRVTFNQAAVGIGHVTPDGRWLRVNQKYCDVVGYSEEELKALTIREITHPDDLETSMKQFQLLLEGKLVNYSLEKRYIRKDGSIVWVNLTASMVFDADGKPRFAVGVVEDITARKRAEEALRFSEARYRTLFRDNPIMIVTLDADLKMLSVNPTCASQLGYTIDELEGQTVLKLFHENDRPAVTEQLRMCLQNPNQVYRWQFSKIRKDGGLLWVEETAQAVYDLSGALNLLVVCQNITERKRAEDELKKTSRQNELILTSAGEGILGLDMEGNHTFVNSSAAAMLEYDVNELIGKNSHATWHHTKADGSSYPAEECPIFAAYKDGTVHSGEEMFWRKDGTGFPVEFISRPILSEGETVGSVLTFNDITERKLMEEEIERLNTDLAARAVELEAANRGLEAFNYSVAHDLRQPLNIISSYCQVIKELCGDKLNEQCKGYLQETYDGTLRMNRLIEALLNFSRMAHIEPRRETVDLTAMAHNVAAELKQTEPGRRVTFLIADSVCADGDAALLWVVLENLLGNAWKYTGKQDEGIIELGTTEIDGRPALFVRDNGAGFDMADAEKLFTPFQRLPGAEEWRGFGVGLATVERIVSCHGGKVWAEGKPGKGATFYFTLGKG